MAILPSELILNMDGSIYHLNLFPEDISKTIITVGDPNRVQSVSKYFDSVEIEKQCREFKTCTGLLEGKRITVISTGIGTDNVDIVLNELDALVNVNFDSKTVKTELTRLNLIRVGTSGSIQEHIEVDSFLISEMALGFDGLMHFYRDHRNTSEDLIDHFTDFMASDSLLKCRPYLTECGSELLRMFKDSVFTKGITATNSGFYAPQGRKIRLEVNDLAFIEKLRTYNFNGSVITNLEMETAGIYGLSSLLGHQAISLNAILANRISGSFSSNPDKTIDKLIKLTLEKIINSPEL